MNDIEKTHYRKAFNSPYLSSADIVESEVLTIKCVRLEPDKTKKTKDHFNTAYFTASEIRKGEPLKPMILNLILPIVKKKAPWITTISNATRWKAILFLAQ